MLALLSLRTWRRVLRTPAGEYPLSFNMRTISTSGSGNKSNGSDQNKGGQEDEEEDQFGLSGFDMDVSADDELDATLKEVTESSADVTPELASELVQKMVESATRSLAESAAPKADILPAITRHTVAVMRASRIATNSVQAATAESMDYPIVKKVTGHVNIANLQLSRPAEEALKTIAGPRLRDSIVKISSEKYPSKAENQLHIVSQIDRLVAAAKHAVGDYVDIRPLESWSDIVGEVELQAADEIIEAGNVSLLLGEHKN